MKLRFTNLRFIQSRSLQSLTGITAALIGCIFFPAAAYADQCALVSKSQAINALTNLRVGQTIYQLCEPCGESTPKAVVIRSLAINSEPSSSNWSVKVNEKEIDLAYVYVDYNKADTRQRVNLAVASGCPARNIRPIISVR